MCDVLIVGSTAAGVLAALGAHGKKASVFLVSDRSFFGEDLTVSLRSPALSDESKKALSGCLEGNLEELRPMQIKGGFDQALLDKNIPFLFNSRPLALLEDNAKRVCGVVFAHRCAWFAIEAKEIVDATLHGLVGRLDLAAAKQRYGLTASFSVLAPAGESESSFEVSGPAAEPAKVKVSQFQEQIGATTVAELAGMEHQIRRKFFSNTHKQTAEGISLRAPWKLSGLSDGLTILGTAAIDDPIASSALVGAEAAERSRNTQNSSGVRVRVTDSAQKEGALQFGPNPLRWSSAEKTLQPSGLSFEVLDEVDVLVVGGGTGGAPAAIGAARAGARTLVLEMLPGLGGVGTLGMIGKYWFGNRVGFTHELDHGAAAMGEGQNPKSAAWNVEWKMAWYLDAITKAGGRVWFGSCAFGVQMEGNRIIGVLVSTPFGLGLVRTKTVIDATGNADIPAAAGAPCRTIDSKHVAVQGTGLPPRQPGAGYRNSDYTFVDENDVWNVTQAFVSGRRKFREEFDLSPLIDSRERRQIIGEAELSPLDFLADRTFPDTIVVARSNFDTHGFTVHAAFMALAPNHKPMDARVPFRCLLPQKVDGVLATGLGVSAHRDALPVIRMQADVQNQGYGAGLAAAMVSKEDKTFRQLDIRALQSQLVKTGILSEEVLQQEDSFPLSDDIVQDAVEQDTYTHHDVSIILANPERAIPLLKTRLGKEGEAGENAALLLGLLGESCAAPALMDWVAKASWDKGWNFTGMGQFGMSTSRLDAAIIALGRTGNLQSVPLLAQKIGDLTAESEFSHCRAVALAACCLRSPALAETLAKVLQLPGVGGQTWDRIQTAVENTDDDSENTITRNLSLRELVLARALYQCGDHGSIGRETLEKYATDLRGHYSSHATALLAEAVETSAPLSKEKRLEIA